MFDLRNFIMWAEDQDLMNKPVTKVLDLYYSELYGNEEDV